MVAHNPLFSGRFTLKKFQATVLNDIWPEVLFFTALEVKDLGFNSVLLPVLGTALSLVISFRTSSAYERYQDGRKMWTNIAAASRSLGRTIWIHVPLNREDKGLQRKQTTLESIIEKKSFINLLQAFPVAVKHFLRGEQGVYYEDLYPLVSFLPRYANGINDPTDRLPLWHSDDNEQEPIRSHVDNPSHDQEKCHRHERGEPTLVEGEPDSLSSSRIGKKCENSFYPEALPDNTIYDFIPLLRLFRWAIRAILRRAAPRESRCRKARHVCVDSNVPLEIILFLDNYTAFLARSDLIQPPIVAALGNHLATLEDTLSKLESTCNTPLPFAYQAHLRMSLWMFLLFLPFQVVTPIGWVTIPGTAFASFLLLGFLEIGQEIENPFDYELNDLDLDCFCEDIQRQLHEITAHTNPDPSEFIFSPSNQPLVPADERNAAQIVASGENYQTPEADADPGMNSVRRTLVRSWKAVNTYTRDGNRHSREKALSNLSG
ncbi:UPF0187-domain-containing protein [Coprinellus micaceus]|uniref:UPF0187-domain-containing protein n=1 Tax=Coprinellus micaceus TaxID=71717 RepID=A0A4Y7SKY2_COPMI|nr:UPF0187-domain-containing protein [Coprinellus micaceus]